MCMCIYMQIHVGIGVWGGVKYTCMCICDSMVNMYNMHVHVRSACGKRRPEIFL